MSASSDTLRRRFPEFASTADYPDTTVDAFIADAADELDAEVWGGLFSKGSIALAAHMMAVAKRSSSAAGGGLSPGVGGISAVKTGDEQINYGAVGAATADSDEAALKTTLGGLEFLRLEAQVNGTPMMAWGVG